jgi:3-hydroxyisobutyrate dehydrogenase-like beta-hydroxyacid dehydrogenase
MCQCLLTAGHDVAVWNRTPANAQPLVDAGATLVSHPSDLAGREVVFTMVAASEHLQDVTLGAHGLLTGDTGAPGILVDCSTVSAETSEIVRRRADARGTALLAAPVSGNPKTIKAGRLTFVVSGPRDAFERVRPLLLDIGADATYAGEGEEARLVKICHNILLGIVAQGLAEITILAERGGVRRSDLLQFVNSSVMGSVFSRYKTPALVNLDYTVTFTPALLRKDLELGLAAADDLSVPLPVTAHVRDIVTGMMEAGYVDVDFAALLDVAAQAAGMELEPENIAGSDGLSGPQPAAVR